MQDHDTGKMQGLNGRMGGVANGVCGKNGSQSAEDRCAAARRTVFKVSWK